MRQIFHTCLLAIRLISNADASSQQGIASFAGSARMNEAIAYAYVEAEGQSRRTANAAEYLQASTTCA